VLHIFDAALYLGSAHHEDEVFYHCDDSEGQYAAQLQLDDNVLHVVNDVQETRHYRETHDEIVKRDRDVRYVSPDTANRERPNTDRAQNPVVRLEDVSDVSLITEVP